MTSTSGSEAWWPRIAVTHESCPSVWWLRWMADTANAASAIAVSARAPTTLARPTTTNAATTAAYPIVITYIAARDGTPVPSNALTAWRTAAVELRRYPSTTIPRRHPLAARGEDAEC